MGLSGSNPKTPDLPAVKSVGELTTEATQANIANLPAIIEAFNKYGPEAASTMLTTAQALNPTLKPLGDLINTRLGEAQGGGIPDTLRQYYEKQFREGMASRGFLDSPISAHAEAIDLAGKAEDYNVNTMNAANSYASNLPKSPTLGDLGLDLPGIDEGVSTAQASNVSDIDRAVQQQAIDAANKKKKNSLIGSALGGGIGGIISGGNPAAMYEGAQIGGTFF